MQSILKPTDNSATTQPTLPPAHRVQRVAFQTDCAAKPISKIELKVLKGEWSMFKVGVQIVPPSFFATYIFFALQRPRELETSLYSSLPSKTRLGALLSGRENCSFKQLSAKAGSGWGFIRNIADVRPRAQIPSSPKKIYKAKPVAPVAEPLWLKRKPRFGHGCPLTTTSPSSALPQRPAGTYRSETL
ncbi:hypothetical protein B0H13DRAFT_2365254 [Mycena leptocephala]|nr:hypothetical protein B0H13DRAFT_2365254 [Mycena leptocephala]